MCNIDLTIRIPSGMKTGKYLGRYILKEEEYRVWYELNGEVVNCDDYGEEENVNKCWSGINLSDLVQGCNKYYYYSVLSDFGSSDFTEVMSDCHSCMSDEEYVYGGVLGRLKDIRMVVVYNELQRRYTARCLVNIRNGCMSKVYGDEHYILESRLLYCGFEKGKITDNDTEFKKALCDRLHDELISDEDGIHTDIRQVKSERVKDSERLFDPTERYLRIKRETEEERERIWNMAKDKCRKKGIENPSIEQVSECLSPYNLDCLSYERTRRNDALAEVTRYKRKLRKYGCDSDGMLLYRFTRIKSISETHIFIKGNTKSFKSRFYSDDNRCWVNYSYTLPDCWVTRGGVVQEMFGEDSL